MLVCRKRGIHFLPSMDPQAGSIPVEHGKGLTSLLKQCVLGCHINVQ